MKCVAFTIAAALLVAVFHGTKTILARYSETADGTMIRGQSSATRRAQSSAHHERSGWRQLFLNFPAVTGPSSSPDPTPTPPTPTPQPSPPPTPAPTSQPTKQPTPAPARRCRVFLSSNVYDGDLDGMDGADDKCNSLATSAGLISSDESSFKAILFSDQENDPDYDPRYEFSDCSDGYYLVNTMGNADLSKKVADDRDDLFDPDTELQNAIDYFEDGTERTGTRNVWTGVKYDDGEFIAGDEDCYQDWHSVSNDKTGRRGRSTATDRAWLDVGTSDCDDDRRIYCAEQL